MKKIYAANLTTTTNAANEYQWSECSECEYSHEWDGDVRGYVENLLDDPDDIITDHEYAIHNFPHGAILVGYNGLPHSIFWSEEADDDESPVATEAPTKALISEDELLAIVDACMPSKSHAICTAAIQKKSRGWWHPLHILELKSLDMPTRFDLLLRPEILPRPLLFEISCLFAEYALDVSGEAAAQHEQKSRSAIAAMRGWLRGKVSAESVRAARVAAWDAGRTRSCDGGELSVVSAPAADAIFFAIELSSPDASLVAQKAAQSAAITKSKDSASVGAYEEMADYLYELIKSEIKVTKIFSAGLTTGNDYLYQWCESHDMEYGHEWFGDVRGYVENLIEDPDEFEILGEDDYTGTAIHNLPSGALIILEGGEPREIYWAGKGEYDPRCEP